MSEPVIQTEGLVKIFSDFWHRRKIRAVDGLNLRVEPGEIYGLLGPNGSGKSTIMKLLLGLLHPSAGKVALFGAPPSKSTVRARIGYLPEESQLYGHLTARETLRFYGRLFGLPSQQLAERAEQLLTMTGLDGAADRPVGQYSKGMTRRIGLAQALINDPDLLILDEPTAGLDPPGCRQIKDLLLALAERGKTVLVSSHLLADMEDVCSRIMLLHNGITIAEGGIAELLEEPGGVGFVFRDVSPEAAAQLKAAVGAAAGDAEYDVIRPRRSLEEFFIAKITEAGGGATRLSGGVRLSAELAPFIRKS